MALTFVQTNQVSPAANAASAAVAYSVGTTLGSYLLVWSWTNIDVISSVTDTLGNVWSQATAVLSGGGGTVQIFHVPVNKAGGANTVTIHYANSNNSFAEVIIAEYTGQSVAAPFDVNSAILLTTTASLVAPAVNTNSTNETVLFAAITGDAPVWTGTGGYTVRNQTAGFILLEGSAPTRGSYAPTATLNGAQNVDGLTWSLRSSTSVPLAPGGGDEGPAFDFTYRL